MTTQIHPGAVASHTAEGLQQLFAQQQAFFQSGVTRSYGFRKGQLAVLRKAIARYEQPIQEALYKDLRKNEFETYGTELGPAYKELTHTQQNLRGWMQPRQRSTPLMFFPSTSKVVPEPRGVSLIMAPWNYPFLLLIQPMIASIAAGNTCILKPSEEAPHVASVLKQMIDETFEPDYIAVVTGPGQQVSEQLIARHHLDLVFFTGSTAVGRKIMQAAATQLTPVVLELGGKSPCIVAADASIDYTAKKIIFSRFLNCGQTCVAADYVLVQHAVKDKLIAAIKKQLLQMYGNDPQQSPDLGRIINLRQFNRLVAYLSQGNIVHGGQHDTNDLYIAPTILTDVAMDAPIMREEIFGPILPIIGFDTHEEAKEIIAKNPYPLALYVYTNSSSTERYFMEGIQFGGGCVNNGIIHLGNTNLPFTGVGYSGMGGYHGQYGFDQFSHLKSIMRSHRLGDTPLWYAPYKKWYVQVLRKLMR